MKAILFDHDGTLINSEAVHFALWQQVLRPFQVELTEQYYNDVMAGIPVPQNAIDAVRDFKLPISAEELAESNLDESELRKIDVQITRLRQKIEINPKQSHYIKTIRGKGYKLICDDL